MGLVLFLDISEFGHGRSRLRKSQRHPPPCHPFSSDLRTSPAVVRIDTNILGCLVGYEHGHSKYLAIGLLGYATANLFSFRHSFISHVGLLFAPRRSLNLTYLCASSYNHCQYYVHCGYLDNDFGPQGKRMGRIHVCSVLRNLSES